MSATNRGAVRQEKDFYTTPKEAFMPLLPYIPKNVHIHEPACGDSRLARWMTEAGVKVVTQTDLALGCDFLKDETHYSFILTNPPFSLAFDFCRHARKHSVETMFLLRLNFLASQHRYDWFCKNEPSALFVLSDRPDFTGGGGDACDYAWFYWGFRYKGIFHLYQKDQT